MFPAQQGQSAIDIGISIGIGIIMSPLQHHIIAGIDPPLV
ncbi:hypothetical protein MycrhN_2805 [Mycolicibacterium rhodesiae NBB3]|uniref:Uncharacterized protein n=1 Tax=Mycolicibacterium rhodesiae (strain NBB3) TaxID=710685 RepID=G8RI41_MYCRN|nr:hypothetical protein MycrhN_2805 [Mycolicibacterium rhodesiae NBB3]